VEVEVAPHVFFTRAGDDMHLEFSVVLHLVDQMHGLRRSMRDLIDEMRAGGRP
jgi:hypothetical protein